MDELKRYAYDLNSPSERARLWRELDGYLNTCERHHHGTDFAGRQFARQALQQLSGFGENVAPDPAVVELVRAARQWHKLSDKLSSMQISYRDYARELSTKVALAAGEVHARLTPFQHIKDAE